MRRKSASGPSGGFCGCVAKAWLALMWEFSVLVELVGQKVSQKNSRIYTRLSHLGLAIAKRLQNFGINRIIYNNRRPSEEGKAAGYEYADLDTLLKESDFLICTCAATKETERIFK